MRNLRTRHAVATMILVPVPKVAFLKNVPSASVILQANKKVLPS
jgi:hypothetical protein